jgi:hypothetical protein
MQKEIMRTIRVQKNTVEPSITEDKHRIYEALKSYRKKNGLGCFKQISETTGGIVAINTIANMYTGVKVKNEIWQLVGQALETLNEQPIQK